MQHTTQFATDPANQPASTTPEGTTAEIQVQDNGTFSGRALVPMDPNKAAEIQDKSKQGTPTVERPEWIPEKFWKGSVEESTKEMGKSYTELEKAFHSKGGKPAEEKPADAPKDGEQKATLASILPELQQNGQISEETFAKLEKDGVDRVTAESFIAGQQALASKLRLEIAQVVGGEEQLNKVLEFAKSNPEAAKAYDAAAATQNVELVKLALAGLNAAYLVANPAGPNLITGEPVPGSGGAAPFASNAEMVRAMQDPKYALDPAYREQVARRLAVSR